MQIEKDIQPKEIQEFLQKIGFLKGASEKVLFSEVPGEGNMNIVLRIKTNERSFILKQSKPYVQKYKEIPAPVNRINSEYQFYKTLESNSVNLNVPKLLGFYKDENVLFFEDLGHCTDFSEIYKTRIFTQSQLTSLITIIKNVHQTKAPSHYPKNKELRILNHQHIFEFPFLTNNDFSLDTVQNGLENLSIPYKKDHALKQKIKEVGDLYLSDGDVLLHGDFYPGSWMKNVDEIYVLDPEFTFLGFAEFDLGVMAAHIIIATMDTGVIDKVIQEYNNPINHNLLKKTAGIEIMRRIIGLAQLPLERSLKEKESLLRTAHELIMK